MTGRFISDLHLHPSRPAATLCFLKLLEQTAATQTPLYILGDLFEAWIGDDAPSPHDRQVMAALRNFTASGTRCAFLAGNRDFLVGPRFAAETGTRLLNEEMLLELDGRPVLLMHGDTLCTDDHDYQRYRRIVRRPEVRRLFLALPIGLRKRIAGYARGRSAAGNAIKAEKIMDVNDGTVVSTMERHHVDLLIHGHTHRPAVHQHPLAGRTGTRIVLGAWYEQGSVLDWTRAGPELRSVPFT